MTELIVDNFAGGGGASTGIEMALGRSPDIAINHSAEAIAMHEANHPACLHLREDVFKVDPIAVTKGRRVGLAWFSPDCKHFSKAKGGKPRDQKIRGLAWVMVKWITAFKNAKLLPPRVCVLENVEEFKTWGPLLDDGSPCPRRKGNTFKSFLKRLHNLGYEVEWRELRACDYGAPTIRKRLFLIARCDGQPIVWPAPTHIDPKLLVGRDSVEPKLKPWRTAAECIDWSLPCHSIFLSKTEGRKVRVNRPLADATLRRIARGLKKFVFDAKQPFIVSPVSSLSASAADGERAGVRCAPFLTECANATHQRVFAATEPLRTQCAQVKGGHFALVSAFLAKHFSGEQVHAAPLNAPLPTITTRDHNALVTADLFSSPSPGGEGRGEGGPLTDRADQVRAFFVKYYGDEHNVAACTEPLHTVTTRERMGIVTVEGQDYAIADIGMRMLKPHELFRGQGFPPDYIIAPHWQGKPLTEEAQVRLCGNSVSPPVAAAIVAANVPELALPQHAAA